MSCLICVYLPAWRGACDANTGGGCDEWGGTGIQTYSPNLSRSLGVGSIPLARVSEQCK
jgi:hypothetical protein